MKFFEAYGEMKAEQDLLAVGYTALLGYLDGGKKAASRRF